MYVVVGDESGDSTVGESEVGKVRIVFVSSLDYIPKLSKSGRAAPLFATFHCRLPNLERHNVGYVNSCHCQ